MTANYKTTEMDNLVTTADALYKTRDYRVAYFMYRDALKEDPDSLMLLKKAANCAFFDVMGQDVVQQLNDRIAALQEEILKTGDGQSPEKAFKVTRTGDAYQILWDRFGVKDVLSREVLKEENGYVYNALTVMTRTGKEPEKVYFACYGETEADAQDYFIRKKGF